MYEAQMHNDFKTSTNEWIGKMCHAYTTQYLLLTRNKIVSFSGKQMEVNSIGTSGISQTQRNVFSIICKTGILKGYYLGGRNPGRRKGNQRR